MEPSEMAKISEPGIPEELTIVEKERLEYLEEEFEQLQENFKRGGTILVEVRDSKLYRAEYRTFQEYCERRWGLSQRHAYRLMEAEEIRGDQDVCPTGQTSWSPMPERHARELAKLKGDPE